MDLLGIGVLLVVGIGVMLFIVLLLTRGIFARDLTQALRRVHQQEQELQEKAVILEQRINQMEQEYQGKLKRAQAEGERITQEAKHQAMNIRTTGIEEAKHRARQLFLEAEHGKAQWKQELMHELDGAAIQRAGETLRDLLPPAMLASLHDALVVELLGTLEAMDVAPLRTGGLERLDVRSARPLAPAQTERLSRWIAASVGRDVPVQVDADPSLVAGCVVRLGSTIVDNSLVNRMRQP